MAFETKKIRSETLSEYLQEVRQEFQLSIEEVSQKTGIKQQYLHHLEDGDLHCLPPDVYVLGFLKDLAAFYHVSSQLLIAQYKKERGIAAHTIATGEVSTTAKLSWWSRLVITPRFLSAGLGVLFIVFTLGYMGVQVAAINNPPVLEVLEPKPDEVVNGSVVMVNGKTEPGISITVNDQIVFVDNGKFHFPLGIGTEPGQKHLVVRATDKFKNSTEKIIAVVVNPELVATSSTGEASMMRADITVPEKSVTLELKFTDTADIDVIVDGMPLPSERVANGNVKIISAKRDIFISTSDAGAIEATLNGQLVGKLGKKNEPLSGIPFTAAAAPLIQESR